MLASEYSHPTLINCTFRWNAAEQDGGGIMSEVYSRMISERQRIAEAFGVAVEDVSWGHSMDPRNIRYRQHGFKKSS